MKHFIGSIIPFLFFHLVCCGGFLIFLTTSGYLLLVRREGSSKLFLLPLVGLGILFFTLYRRQVKHCNIKNHSTVMDHGIIMITYVLFSLFLGIAFMIYVFIPWWIPNYQGGALLP